MAKPRPAVIYFSLIFSSLLIKNSTAESFERLLRSKTDVNMLDRGNYDGFQVYTVILKSLGDFPLIEELKRRVPLDIWKQPTPASWQLQSEKFGSASGFSPSSQENFRTDFMVSSEHAKVVTTFLKGHESKLSFRVMIPNVGTLINVQREENSRGLRSQSGRLNWNAYFRLEEIYSWLEELVANNTDIASMSTIGTSTEGRPLKLVKISKPGSPTNKSAILIDGGFHAREWISPAIVTYILDQVLNNRTANSEVLDNVDLYIIPIVNVDGYEHSHERARLWRKTRSDHGSPFCLGVDPNRNFDFHFGGPGTSNDRCSEIYHGPEAFSEPETRAVRDVMLNKSINWQSYLTIHSYGQWWLTPWSWTLDLPEDYADLIRFGKVGADALTSIHGTKFIVGATTEILGTTAGCADDWAKAVAGIKYANTIEVRDTGRYGFLLPPQQIQATSEETWAGIRAVSLFKF